MPRNVLSRPFYGVTPARSERLPPGEGGIDLSSILAHMPQGILIALEVPMQAAIAAEGAEAVARRVLQAAKQLLVD